MQTAEAVILTSDSIKNHLFPGSVQTDLTSVNNVDPLIAFAFDTFAWLFGQTPQHYGEVAVHVATTWDRPGLEREEARFWGYSGQRRRVKDYPRRCDIREGTMAFFESSTGLTIEGVIREKS